jgi:integrase
MSKQPRVWEPKLYPGHKDKHSRDQRWRVQYEDPTTFLRRTKGGFKRKADASAWREDFLAQTRQNNWTDPAQGAVTFHKLAEEWLASRHFPKQRTANDLRQMLLTATRPDSLPETFGRVPVGDVTYQAVRNWLKTYKATKSATTVRNNFYALRTVLDYAVDTRRISENPARQGDLRKRKALPSPKRVSDAQDDRYHLTAQQVGAIAQSLPQPYDTYALLVASTGMRPGEACGLRVRDVDLDQGTVSVRQVISQGRREDSPKNDHSIRTVTLDDAVLAALRTYLRDHLTRALAWFTAHPDQSHPATPYHCSWGWVLAERTGSLTSTGSTTRSRCSTVSSTGNTGVELALRRTSQPA